jgi:hypothetical protein
MSSPAGKPTTPQELSFLFIFCLFLFLSLKKHPYHIIFAAGKSTTPQLYEREREK